MHSFRRISSILFLISNLFLLLSCNTQKKVNEIEKTIKHDITLNAVFEKDEFRGHTITKLKYKWKTGSQFLNSDENLIAKVHFIDSKGTVVFQDDHIPEPPFNEWINGSSYEYERIIYIPVIPKIEKISAIAGLYNPAIHATHFLNGQPYIKDYYQIGQFILSPPQTVDDLPDARVKYITGFYGVEKDPKSKMTWRWMDQKGECMLQNPHREAQLYIRGWFNTPAIGKKASLILHLGDQEIGRYDNLENEFSILLAIPESIFDREKEKMLTLESNVTYVPSNTAKSNDNRRLAVMIKNFFYN